MVRAPFCDNMGLKKGKWSPEEDRKLTAYIKRYGSWNWRELPKYAGLSRCGKSCRLRWMNYLRPDIKRGNFTREEEKIIRELHESLGNRWSAIAAKLPGRTDNETKNHWHTNLKKCLKKKSAASVAKLKSHKIDSQSEEDEKMELTPGAYHIVESCPIVSPQPSSSEFSSLNSESVVASETSRMEDVNVSSEILAEPKGDFWTEPYLLAGILEDIPPSLLDPRSLFPLSPISLYEPSFSEFSSLNWESVIVSDTSRMEDINVSSEILAEPKGDFGTEPYLLAGILEDIPPSLLDPRSLFPLSPISLYEPSFSEFSSLNWESVIVSDTSRMEDINTSTEVLAEPKEDFWTEPYLAGMLEDIPPTLLDPVSLFPLSPVFSLCGAYSDDSIGWFNQFILSDPTTRSPSNSCN